MRDEAMWRENPGPRFILVHGIGAGEIHTDRGRQAFLPEKRKCRWTTGAVLEFVMVEMKGTPEHVRRFGADLLTLR